MSTYSLMIKFIKLLIYCLISANCLAQQEFVKDTVGTNRSNNTNARFNENIEEDNLNLKRSIFFRINKMDSVVYLEQYYFTACKLSMSKLIYTKSNDQCKDCEVKALTNTPILHNKKKAPFLKITGDIYYDFFYRSRTDTPFMQNSISQHSERINLSIQVRNGTPLKLSFNSRQSNSPFYRNYFDPVFKFDANAFKQKLKEKYVARIKEKFPETEKIHKLTGNLEQLKNEVKLLERKIKDPGLLQKIIEQREFEYRDSIGKHKTQVLIYDSLQKISKNNIISGVKDSLHDELVDTDSLSKKVNKFESERDAFLKHKSKNLSKVSDSLRVTLLELESKVADKKAELEKVKRNIDSLQESQNRKLTRLKNDMANLSNQEIKKLGKKFGVYEDSVNGFKRFLSGLNAFELGRIVINYSDLTATNVVINGLNIGYSSRVFTSFALGKVDYRFRDFFNRKQEKNNQYLAIGKIGFGNPDKKSIALTVYKGRKNQTEFNLLDTAKRYIDITGFSVEIGIKYSPEKFIVAEFAKSTKPMILTTGAKSEVVNELTRFRDKSNMGLSLKGQTVIEKTSTKISGWIRKTGEQFQCFSLFNYLTNQTAWQARIDQPFLKRKIHLTGMLRKNDFINPFTEQNIKTSSVFASLVANIRIPKLPILSVGYFPGSQVFIVDNDRLQENIYYIMNGSMIYNYRLKNLNMNSSMVYNRYYNKATDSGLVANEGVSWYASQTVFLKRIQLLAGYSFFKQPELSYKTIESGIDFNISSRIKLGGTFKGNYVKNGETYIGHRYLISLDAGKIGQLQINYEKSYLPSVNNSLYPMETGRLIWYKKF
jgi:hypothetical protein